MILVLGVWTFLRAILGNSAVVTLENVALRHQLAVMHRAIRRPRLRRRDRIFCVLLSRVWPGWRSTLVVVPPAPLPAGHRTRFQLHWREHARPRSAGPHPLHSVN